MALTIDVGNIESSSGIRAVKVILTGDLDSASGQQFKEAMDKLYEKGNQKFILDCEYLDFVGSSALARILHYTDMAEENGGGLALVRASKKLLMVLETMGFNEVINVFGDQQMALYWLEGKGEE